MFSRRGFLAGSLALTDLCGVGEVFGIMSFGKEGLAGAETTDERSSLVPNSRGNTASYLDTWHAQYYLAASRLQTHDLSLMMGAQGSRLARAELTEANLLGPGGMADTCYPPVRQDLYFVLDDGWDVPPDGNLSSVGSQELDLQRFPSMRGTPQQRLAQLNLAFQKKGWRAAGLWIAAQIAPSVIARDKQAGKDTESDAYFQNYWIERLGWSEAAGIRYWKVDWGKKAGDVDFRVMLSGLAQRYAPNLVIEGTLTRGPLNGYEERIDPHHGAVEGRVSSEWIAHSIPLLRLPGTFRTYDTLPFLAVPTTLDRVAGLLQAVNGDPTATTVLNCQDEVYLGAVLGCDLGMMRQAVHVPGVSDVSDQTSRHAARRLVEVERAVRWQRIAPPVPVGVGTLAVDRQLLVDTWKFSPGETWMTSVIGREVKQAAPARIARGIPLPEVTATGVLPYVIAGKHPNGSLAVGTIGRMSSAGGWQEPLADVSIGGGEQGQKIGVFGRFGNLSIRFDKPIKGRRVWAQDLASTRKIEITSRASMDGSVLHLEGALIDAIGESRGAKEDGSNPGIVLLVS